MDEFFQPYTSQVESMPWFEEALLVDKSAFERYTTKPNVEGLQNHRNVNRRMMEFLKKSSWIVPMEIERDKSEKHKMSERMRREKHRHSYLTLHELLPAGTKSDRNSILEMAAKEIGRLQECKREMEGKNGGMEMILAEKAVLEKAEIEVKVGNPASGIDSMLEVLRCLRDTGSTATAIKSRFSQNQFSALFQFETKMRAADVEKAVQRTLLETEKKLRSQT